MVNCTSDDFTNSDKSIKSLESYILKTREPLLTTLSSLQDSQHPQNCKSAFSRVKSTSTNCQELDHSDMIEQQIPSPLNKYRLNQVTISNLINNTDNTNNNSNLDSTYKSVRIDTEFNSPISDSSNPELGGTLYFSLIDILSSNSNSPSPTTYSLLPPSFHELKSDQELPEMIENEGSYEHKKGTNYPTLNEELKSGSPELKRVQSIDRGLPEKLGALHDCHHHHDPRHRFSQQLARTDLKKRAGSLTNPSLLKQFQLENRLPTQNSRIYGSSQEFLANIDTAMPMKNEACFATTHPKYHSHLTQSERKMSLNIPATIENKEVKILDKNHNNQADDMFTVFETGSKRKSMPSDYDDSSSKKKRGLYLTENLQIESNVKNEQLKEAQKKSEEVNKKKVSLETKTNELEKKLVWEKTELHFKKKNACNNQVTIDLMVSEIEKLKANIKLEKEEANNWKKEYETTNEQLKEAQKKSEANNEFLEVKKRLATKITDEKIVDVTKNRQKINKRPWK